MDLDESFANLSVASDIGASPRRKNPVIQKFYNLSPHHARDPAVAVVLSPQCYKHEFSRFWESKPFLKSIVERPERLNACALGIGAAETKIPLQLVECLGGRDLRKSDSVRRVHGQEWIDKLYNLCQQVSKLHADHKVEVPDTWPAGDMYLATETVRALESVVASIEQALGLIYAQDKIKRVFCCVRPPGHHCHQDAASGFCLVNNAHIAIQESTKYGVTHAVIFDFDLHHGDGTQDLCWKMGGVKTETKNEEEVKTEESKAGDAAASIPIGYYSIHDIHSFPTEKDYADPANIMAASTCVEGHDMHIWNVHLETWDSPDAFNQLYNRKYSALFKQAVKFLKKYQDTKGFKPLIVISAGFDGSEYEMKSMQRHKVSVPTSFFNRFTRDCVALADSFSQGRVLSLLEGGYSNQALATGVFSHLTGLGGLEYDESWITETNAAEFDRGAKKAWKNHLEWPGDAIQMGRQLFALRPSSAPQTLSSPAARTRSKRLNLR